MYETRDGGDEAHADPAVTRISGAGMRSFGANEAAAEITNCVMTSRMTIVCVSACKPVSQAT